MNEDTRFAADAMLGRLARWLAETQARILLTRDRRLLQDLRPVRAHEVRQDEPLQQLRDLVLALRLPGPSELFTRCSWTTRRSSGCSRAGSRLEAPGFLRSRSGPFRP